MGSQAAAKGRTIELLLKLRLRRAGVEPEVRAWVDEALSGQLKCEYELPLAPGAEGGWSARFHVREGGTFLYRLGIRAHAGAEWSLRIVDHSLGRCLLVDGDELAVDKCHLVGSVELPSQLSTPPKRWERALVLVRGASR